MHRVTTEPRQAPNRAAALCIAGAGLLCFAVVWALILGRAENGSTPFDSWWAGIVGGAHAAPLTVLAYVLNLIGGTIGSIIVVALLAIALFAIGRRWAAVHLVLAGAGGALAVQAVKHLVARPRPEDMMVVSDFGSFPSGHSAQAAVLAIMLALSFPAARWLRLAAPLYVLLMMLSRTYLSAHWLSDTIAGALLGGSVALLAWALLGDRVLGEPRPSRTPSAG